jgi:8-oxo-dGTP pyrophosphatase MutT (NUDIX family)
MSQLRLALEPVITPLFRTWWRINRGLTLGVRGLVTDEDGRVLLVRHTYRPGWFFPGGGVEKNETVELALIRELQEEAGVAVEGAPSLFGVYSNAPNFPNDHVLFYQIASWRAVAPANDGEIAERGFFPLHALPDGVSGGTRQRLAEVFHAQPIAAFWAPPTSAKNAGPTPPQSQP